MCYRHGNRSSEGQVTCSRSPANYWSNERSPALPPSHLPHTHTPRLSWSSLTILTQDAGEGNQGQAWDHKTGPLPNNCPPKELSTSWQGHSGQAGLRSELPQYFPFHSDQDLPQIAKPPRKGSWQGRARKTNAD